MRTIFFCLLSLALLPLAHGDELLCSTNGGSERTELSDGQAVVALKGEKLETEASLAPSSFLASIQDKESPTRTAFVGHPSAAARGSLVQGKHRLDCSRNKAPLAFAPKRSTNYLLCFLDEVEMKNAEIGENKRQLAKVIPVVRNAMPRSLEHSNEKYSYKLSIDDLNSVNGFKLAINDHASGLSTSFEGPASSFANTVMLALTIGDREKDARYLRVACQFTNTQEFIKDVK
jgi:hypothetical protein